MCKNFLTSRYPFFSGTERTMPFEWGDVDRGFPVFDLTWVSPRLQRLLLSQVSNRKNLLGRKDNTVTSSIRVPLPFTLLLQLLRVHSVRFRKQLQQIVYIRRLSSVEIDFLPFLIMFCFTQMFSVSTTFLWQIVVYKWTNVIQVLLPKRMIIYVIVRK